MTGWRHSSSQPRWTTCSGWTTASTASFRTWRRSESTPPFDLTSPANLPRRRRKSVFQQNQELEDLQARIRAAEARLKAAGSAEVSPSSSTANSPQRNAAKAIFATMAAPPIPEEPEAEGAEPRSPDSTPSGEYIVVERPKPVRPIPRTRLRKPGVVEESSEEEDDDEDSEEEAEEEAEEDVEEEDSTEGTDSGSEESDES